MGRLEGHWLSLTFREWHIRSRSVSQCKIIIIRTRGSSRASSSIQPWKSGFHSLDPLIAAWLTALSPQPRDTEKVLVSPQILQHVQSSAQVGLSLLGAKGPCLLLQTGSSSPWSRASTSRPGPGSASDRSSPSLLVLLILRRDAANLLLWLVRRLRA